MRFAGPASPEVEYARDVIERQLQHMTRLIDDLLDVSRISRNKLELRKESVDLVRVLQSAVETSRPLIDSCGHQLSVMLTNEPVHLSADVTRLGQVFSNLLNNAAKYTPRGGRIALHAEREGNHVAVAVRDNGIGIPKDKLLRVFDLFTQLNRSLESANSGLGIGLTLAKRLVEMHEGIIEAHSDRAGHGSEFIVRLPISTSHEVDVVPSTDDSVPFAVTHRRILIVDDNHDVLVSSEMMLRFLGYQTCVACDGVAALEAVEDFVPDIVLLDIGMPKLNGYQVARRIREQPWGKDLILIALTGWGQAEDKQHADEAGFDYHLVKPVRATTLARLLASLPKRELLTAE
jgi:CheY-like chemotaxis protein